MSSAHQTHETRHAPRATRHARSCQVLQRDRQLLLVSQFTLYAQTSKGTKPDFHLAMPPQQARVCAVRASCGARVAAIDSLSLSLSPPLSLSPSLRPMFAGI